MPRTPDDHPSRRAVLGAGAAVTGWGVAQAAAQEVPKPAATVPADAMAVTLRGTGSPDPRPDRFGMSTLVQAGGLNLVFDAGRGCTVRLRQAGVASGKVDALFITHFHSDHLNGLPDLWLTGFLSPYCGARRQPFELRGPQGIGRIATTMHATFADDVRTREEDEHVPEDRTLIAAHEFAADGVVFERSGVAVTAFEVNHGPLIKPAYGYRVDHAGRSVLLSGGHEVRREPDRARARGGPDGARGRRRAEILHGRALHPGDHGTPHHARAGRHGVQPRLAVFSHIVQLTDDKLPRPGMAEIEEGARTAWSGGLLVGSDLDRFVLTPAGVGVQHYDHARGQYPG